MILISLNHTWLLKVEIIETCLGSCQISTMEFFEKIFLKKLVLHLWLTLNQYCMLKCMKLHIKLCQEHEDSYQFLAFIELLIHLLQLNNISDSDFFHFFLIEWFQHLRVIYFNALMLILPWNDASKHCKNSFVINICLFDYLLYKSNEQTFLVKGSKATSFWFVHPYYCLSFI